MKRTLGLTAIALSVAVTAGCSTIARQNHPTDTAALDAKALAVQSRPVEMGLELVGDSEGAASATRVFGFLVDGDAVKTAIPLMGQISGDPLQELAAYRAARANKSDAVYILRTEEDKTGFGFFYNKRTVRVYGKTYKAKDLGLMSAERADKLSTAPAGSAASGSKKGGLFGFFGF